MGGCLSGPDAITRQIDKTMAENDQKEKQKQKLMLLGSGSSGKSTIFKQLNWLYAADADMPDTVEPMSQKKNIRENVITGLWTLIVKAGALHEEDEEKFADCQADIELLSKTNPQLVADLKLIYDIQESFSDMSDDQINALNLGPKIKPIWEQDFIQNTYKWRSLYHIYDNIEYFFQHAEEIFKPNYVPSREDILKARIRTTGLVSTTLEIEDERKKGTNVFQIWDAGGQRNERAKWIHQFEGVTGLIFVAALNHYNQVLYEDEKKNAMHESIDLFKKTVNNKYFLQTEVILFLNKRDLFEEDLKKGDTLDDCFMSSHNPDWTNMEFQWNPENNYYPNQISDPEEDQKRFDESYKIAVDFIQNIYQAQSTNREKAMFCHVTCATDKNNVQKVFWDVQNIVIRANLQKFGLMNV